MKTLVLSFIIPLLYCQAACGQFRFSAGPEFGLNTVHLGAKKNYVSSYQNQARNNSWRYVNSPIIGGWAQFKFGNHLFTNVGVQYFKVGEKVYRYWGAHNNNPYASSRASHITFHQLSMPLAIGCNFQVRKLKFRLFAGFRRTYLASGSYVYKTTVYKEDHVETTQTKENPFNEQHFNRPASRWINGRFLGIGVQLAKRLDLNIQYAWDNPISFGDVYSWEGQFHDYIEPNLSFTIRYAAIQYSK